MNVGLLKVALNKAKATQMALDAGLIPEEGSAWRWALRHLRDARGNLLQGRALAEAKERLGRLTNHERQRIQAINRKTGGRFEIGYVSGDPYTGQKARTMAHNLWNKHRSEALEQHIAKGGTEDTFVWNVKIKPYYQQARTYLEKQWTNEIGNWDDQSVGAALATRLHQKAGSRRPMQDLNLGRLVIGSPGHVPTDPLPGNRMTKRTELILRGTELAHTHPSHGRIKSIQDLNEAIQELEDEVNMSPLKLRILKGLGMDRGPGSTRHKLLIGQVMEHQRSFHPVQLTSPSGAGYYDLTGKIIAGDTKAMSFDPHVNYPILSPEANVDSVNRLRPWGMRTIFFQTEKHKPVAHRSLAGIDLDKADRLMEPQHNFLHPDGHRFVGGIGPNGQDAPPMPNYRQPQHETEQAGEPQGVAPWKVGLGLAGLAGAGAGGYYLYHKPQEN